MKPKLPRPLLWTEVQNMDRFLNEDLVNTTIYHVIANLQTIFISTKLDVVKLFNEMYYQMTRIYYEKPLPAEYSKYVNDIKANLGWSYSADLVMAMIFTYIRIKDRRPDAEIKTFLECIAMEQAASPFFIQFTQITSDVLRWPPTPLDPKVPHPVSPKELASIYINWKEITRDFDYETVKEILNLWGDYEDQKYVAQLLKDYLLVGAVIPRIKRYNPSIAQLLEDFINPSKTEEESASMCAEGVAEYGVKDNYEQIEKLEKDKEVLQRRIDELENENQRLNTLLNAKKDATGRKRKFTLGQMVDYCMSKVELSQVEGIINMLNKLLRDGGKKEDYDLVDSIESEFLNRKLGIVKKTQETTKTDDDIKSAIEEMLKAKDVDNKSIFKNKKQWWAVFRVLSKYFNYPNKMTEFVAKINNLNIEQDDKIAISYDSLSAAPKDVPQMSCAPDAWDALKDKSDNYTQQYVVAQYLMFKLGIKS